MKTQREAEKRQRKAVVDSPAEEVLVVAVPADTLDIPRALEGRAAAAVAAGGERMGRQ